MFKEGRTNVHDEERSGQRSVIKDDLVEKMNTTIRGNRRFTISELSLEFPQVSRSVIYDIVSEKLGYKKLCARWVPKMLTDKLKQKRLAAAHQFLQRHQIEGDQSLDHIVTGDETFTNRSRRACETYSIRISSRFRYGHRLAKICPRGYGRLPARQLSKDRRS